MLSMTTIAHIAHTKGVDMFPTTGTFVDMFPHTDGILDMFPHTTDIHSGVPSHVEMVILLSHQKSTEYVQIPYEPETKTAHAFRDATYKEIKDWIQKIFNMKVSNLYIAQIKDECDLAKRENPFSAILILQKLPAQMHCHSTALKEGFYYEQNRNYGIPWHLCRRACCPQSTF